jgi:hypothetical protein
MSFSYNKFLAWLEKTGKEISEGNAYFVTLPIRRKIGKKNS